MLPRPEFGRGHTAQYETLAVALKMAVESLYCDLDELRQLRLSAAGSIAIEARAATITIMSAAFCESAANTILATVLSRKKFNDLHKKPVRTVEKWVKHIPIALPCAPPTRATQVLLELLFTVRNSILHAKATIYADDGSIHQSGTSGHWQHLTPERAVEFAAVPALVTSIIPETADPLLREIASTARNRQPRKRP